MKTMVNTFELLLFIEIRRHLRNVTFDKYHINTIFSLYPSIDSQLYGERELNRHQANKQKFITVKAERKKNITYAKTDQKPKKFNQNAIRNRTQREYIFVCAKFNR